MAGPKDKRSPKRGRGKTPSEPLPPKTVEQYPLDDDTRWRPIGAAYRRRFEQSENIPLSIFQVMDVLEKGELPSKEQSVVTGQSRLVASTEWTERVELRFLSGGPRVFYREPREILRSQVVLLPVRDLQFFVWWPTVGKLWPAVTDQIDKTAHETVAHGALAADQPPALPKITAQEWFIKALKDHPQKQGERPINYARRLLLLKEAAGVTEWSLSTIQRRLYK